MRQVVDDFEEYAKQTYLRAVHDPKANDENLYAGLRFITSRNLRGLDEQLYERFNTRRRGKLGAKIDEACFDALMQTVMDKAALAKFFVEMAKSRWRKPAEKFLPEGIKRIGSTGFTIAFDSLRSSDDADARFRIASLIARAAKMRTLRHVTFWRKASMEEIDAVVDEWEALLIRRGLLDPKPAAAAPISTTTQPAAHRPTDASSNGPE